MATDRDMQAFVVAYEGAWASRVPGAMGALWHPDGVLHHPALVREGRVAEERVYMDTYPLRRRLDPTLPDRPLVDPATLGPS